VVVARVVVEKVWGVWVAEATAAVVVSDLDLAEVEDVAAARVVEGEGGETAVVEMVAKVAVARVAAVRGAVEWETAAQAGAATVRALTVDL
jgi:hypothetical protein